MPDAFADRIRWIEHRGTRILYYDWSNIQDYDQAVALVRASATPMRKEPEGSVLVLTNVEGSRFNKRVLDAVLELMNGNKPHVKASAIAGMNGIMRAAYGALGKLTSRRLHAAATIEEAKDWLASQA